MVGDPDDCVVAVERLQGDRLRPDPHGAELDATGPTSCARESVELFGKQVIPEFDTDPEHSTSRYRREAAARAG